MPTITAPTCALKQFERFATVRAISKKYSFHSIYSLFLQTYSGFTGFKAESVIASVVLISVTRELAPVLSALMVAGRIGAAMAAEIGTMRVTEQIDALVTLSTNPFKYLVAPRLWAGLLVLPILVLIGDIIGIFGGYVVGVYNLRIGFSHGSGARAKCR